MRRTVPFLSLALVVSGCTWIDDAQVKALSGQLDNDGDGVPARDDCDDGDPARSPAEPEIWYDGIDEDCAGDDDYDQDADGYVPTDFVGLTTIGVKGSGLLDGRDCDDKDPMVSPKQPDAWYDGIDQACNGGDDYDQDGDGYVPDEYVGLVTKYVGTSGTLPAGDCDDENAAVNPVAADAWYDGLDANCDTENDYDQDGDGFVPDDWLVEGGGLPGDDCNDEDAAVNPGVDELWYNGVDDACDGLDDYDQDGDGYVRPVDIGKITYTFDLATGETVSIDGTGSLPGDDCDDTNGAAHPYAHELYGDAADEDCDGGRDSVEAVSIVGYTFDHPYTPIFVEADGHLFLSVAVSEVQTPAGEEWFESGFALYWDTTAVGNTAELIQDFAWAKSSRRPTFTVGEAHSFRVFGDVIYGVIGRSTSSYRSMAFESYPLDGTTAGQVTAQSGYTHTPFEDVDVYVDDAGWVYGVGCDGGASGVFTFVSTSSFSTGTSAEVQQNLAAGTASGTACQFAEDEGGTSVLLAQADDLYVASADDFMASEPAWTLTATGGGYVPGDIDTDLDGVSPTLVLAAASEHGVYVEGTGMNAFVGQATDTPVTASAVRIPGGQYLVAWINNDGTIRMAKGNEASGYAYITVNFAEPATGLALWVNEDHAMVAVSGATTLGIGTYDWM